MSPFSRCGRPLSFGRAENCNRWSRWSHRSRLTTNSGPLDWWCHGAPWPQQTSLQHETGIGGTKALAHSIISIRFLTSSTRERYQADDQSNNEKGCIGSFFDHCRSSTTCSHRFPKWRILKFAHEHSCPLALTSAAPNNGFIS